MADMIGTYISHHPPGIMCPEDAIAFGVLAALVNIQQGNNSKEQWQDILVLATSALEMAEQNEPGLFGGRFGGVAVPVNQDLQACKTDATRDENSLLTKPEAIAASLLAHRVKGITLIKHGASDSAIIELAILHPTQMVFGQFIRLCQLLGVQVEEATR